MTHDFTTLTSVLSRCSAKVADQVIAEIRSAIDAAAQRRAIERLRRTQLRHRPSSTNS